MHLCTTLFKKKSTIDCQRNYWFIFSSSECFFCLQNVTQYESIYFLFKRVFLLFAECDSVRVNLFSLQASVSSVCRMWLSTSQFIFSSSECFFCLQNVTQYESIYFLFKRVFLLFAECDSVRVNLFSLQASVSSVCRMWLSTSQFIFSSSECFFCLQNVTQYESIYFLFKRVFLLFAECDSVRVNLFSLQASVSSVCRMWLSTSQFIFSSSECFFCCRMWLSTSQFIFSSSECFFCLQNVTQYESIYFLFKRVFLLFAECDSVRVNLFSLQASVSSVCRMWLSTRTSTMPCEAARTRGSTATPMTVCGVWPWLSRRWATNSTSWTTGTRPTAQCKTSGEWIAISLNENLIMLVLCYFIMLFYFFSYMFIMKCLLRLFESYPFYSGEWSSLIFW